MLNALIGDLWQKLRAWSKDQKLFRAERLLKQVLAIDEKNATAFNRLGILYAKKGDYDEAISQFNSAHQIEPSASSLHNLGLIYYEVGDYKKAAKMFRAALALEEGLASRNIAYAKVAEKLEKPKLMIKHLERAFELDPSEGIFQVLYDAYARTGNKDLAKELKKAYKKATEVKSIVKKNEIIDTLSTGTKQLVEAARQYNNELDRIAAKHGL
jgi:tetratricopeptide (TPR) repeat protein